MAVENNASGKDLEEFEHEAYARTSENNMPSFVTFVPLTEEERLEVEAALSIG
ncbi:hypothetical protein [Streptomyces sp. NBC_01262]|uniref:hypothetical protein n=1 Tax=Streptomyces sp. NBC_01262 TaxID=2903803 RepID=UPI002E2F2A69|nr:hypothetical protein [Streptomyces sp. NBC_01262]